MPPPCAGSIRAARRTIWNASLPRWTRRLRRGSSWPRIARKFCSWPRRRSPELRLLDDLEAVAIGVVKGEHRRNSLPVQQLANVATPVMQPLMRCGGVRTGQADAGLYAGGNALVGPQQCDRRRPAGRGDRDPPATQLGKGHVKLLLHTQRLGIELKCAVLVGDRKDRKSTRLN